MNIEQIKIIVKDTLSDNRYFHSLCVMEKCADLAKKYNVDIDKARKVGIAHDIAKEMSNVEKLKYIKDNNIDTYYVEEIYPGLLHAKIGADIASKKFNFSPDMCLAIKAHTTGMENMDILSKILYIADWIGEDRNFPDTKYLKKLAFENIDKAIVYSLNQVLIEKINKNELLHPDSIFARNYIIENIKR